MRSSNPPLLPGAGFKSFRPQVFTSPGCPYTFETQELLHNHMKTGHGELYCEMLKKGKIPVSAGQQITSSITIPEHPEKQPPQQRATVFDCPECLYAFTSEVFLDKHIKRSHNDLYTEKLRNSAASRKQPEGSFDDKLPLLQGEKSQSSQTQSFSCSECSYSFTSQKYLHKHLKHKHNDCYFEMLRNGPISAASQQIKSPVTRQKYGKPDESRQIQISRSNQDGHISAASQQIKSPVSSQKQAEPDESIPHIHLPLTKALTRPEVKTHQLTSVKGKKTHICKLCNKTFYRSSNQSFKEFHNVSRNQRLNVGDTSFHCTQRDESFNQSADLKTRQRVVPTGKECLHPGRNPFKSKQCDDSFSQLGDLKTQERVHGGEKRFRCQQCNKSFNYLSILKQHQRIHTGEKPFQCQQCDKRFKNQSYLLKTHKCVVGGLGPLQTVSPVHALTPNVDDPQPRPGDISRPYSNACSKPGGKRKWKDEEEKESRPLRGSGYELEPCASTGKVVRSKIQVEDSKAARKRDKAQVKKRRAPVSEQVSHKPRPENDDVSGCQQPLTPIDNPQPRAGDFSLPCSDACPESPGKRKCQDEEEEEESRPSEASGSELEPCASTGKVIQGTIQAKIQVEDSEAVGKHDKAQVKKRRARANEQVSHKPRPENDGISRCQRPLTQPVIEMEQSDDDSSSDILVIDEDIKGIEEEEAFVTRARIENEQPDEAEIELDDEEAFVTRAGIENEQPDDDSSSDILIIDEDIKWNEEEEEFVNEQPDEEETEWDDEEEFVIVVRVGSVTYLPVTEESPPSPSPHCAPIESSPPPSPMAELSFSADP